MAHFNNLTVYDINGKKILDTVEADTNWHYVGAAGEPAFSASWVNFDPLRPARFRKRPDGWVEVIGVIKSGSIGATAFVLPSGYRPHSSNMDFIVESVGAAAIALVFSNGSVYPATGSNTYFFLDGISFFAEA